MKLSIAFAALAFALVPSAGASAIRGLDEKNVEEAGDDRELSILKHFNKEKKSLIIVPPDVTVECGNPTDVSPAATGFAMPAKSLKIKHFCSNTEPTFENSNNFLLCKDYSQPQVIGVITRTWTVTYTCLKGKIVKPVTGVQTITIKDRNPPDLACSRDGGPFPFSLCEDGEIAPAKPTGMATDSCVVDDLPVPTTDSTCCFDGHARVTTVTAEDACGNIADDTCVQTVDILADKCDDYKPYD